MNNLEKLSDRRKDKFYKKKYKQEFSHVNETGYIHDYKRLFWTKKRRNSKCKKKRFA